jgi:Bacterial PH domain
VGLGVGVFTVVGIVLAVKTGDPRWLFVSLPLTVILFVTGRYAPTGYRLAADGVHVERRAGAKVIPYRTITGADAEPRRVAGVAVFGSRGVFGRFGRFWNGSLGHYRLFITNADGIVWLATAHGWIGLSPDRPAEFLERLRARLPQRLREDSHG